MVKQQETTFFVQNGHGLVTYGGMRYQKGHGFFGRMMSGLAPLLRYLGTKGLSTAASIASEAAQDPSNFKKISKRKLAEAGLDMLEDGAQRTKKFIQTGKGGLKYAPKPQSKQPRRKSKKSLRIPGSKFLNHHD